MFRIHFGGFKKESINNIKLCCASIQWVSDCSAQSVCAPNKFIKSEPALSRDVFQFSFLKPDYSLSSLFVPIWGYVV